MEGVRRYLPLTSREVSLNGHACLCYSLRQTADGFYWQLRRERRVVVQTLSLPRALHALRGRLVEHVGRFTPRFTWAHAGVVGWNGRAILLPGNSFAGKSTLVAELVRLGASYYSDEVAMLDESGLVHPYPRPLTLRQAVHVDGKAEALAKQQQLTQPSLAVAVAVFARYTAQPTWQVKELTPGQAVAEGLRYSFGVRHAPVQALQAWSQALRGALCWMWDRGEAADAAALLLKAVESKKLPLSPSSVKEGA